MEIIREQIQYCMSVSCMDCKFLNKGRKIEKCQYLPYKIEGLSSDEKCGKMSSKAKRKLWHFRRGVARGVPKRGRRKQKKL